MTFEELLEKIQTQSGYTQDDFSKNIGISRSTYSNWINGKHLPAMSNKSLSIISEKHQIPLSEILEALRISKQLKYVSTETALDYYDSEDIIIQNIQELFQKNFSDLNSEKMSQCRFLFRNAIRLLEEMNLLSMKNLKYLLWNYQEYGYKILGKTQDTFERYWFEQEYYTNKYGIYENTFVVREFVVFLLDRLK